jgi:hypothetical protein
MRLSSQGKATLQKFALPCVLVATLVCPVVAQNSPGSEKSVRVTLTYMGTAAWEISDDKTVILIDPYLSRILVPLPGTGSAASGRVPGDTRPEHRWNEVVPPDVATIDAHTKSVVSGLAQMLVAHCRIHAAGTVQLRSIVVPICRPSTTDQPSTARNSASCFQWSAGQPLLPIE